MGTRSTVTARAQSATRDLGSWEWDARLMGPRFWLCRSNKQVSIWIGREEMIPRTGNDCGYAELCHGSKRG